MLNAARRGKQRRAQAALLYAAAVTRARQPVFFARFDVPDTLDGRFDLLTVHIWLLLDRLKPHAELSQDLVDAVFVGFDEALREMGAGDIGLGRRVKKLADAFYGRLKAYEEAADASAMEAALTRNLYRGASTPCAGVLAGYVMAARQHLSAWDDGEPDFGPLPAPGTTTTKR